MSDNQVREAAAPMRGINDLLAWLEYGRQSGYTASRQSKEQEEHWADLLRPLITGQQHADVRHAEELATLQNNCAVLKADYEAATRASRVVADERYEYIRQCKNALAEAQNEKRKAAEWFSALVNAEAERDKMRTKLLTAAGDDLCRLSQEEIKAMALGAVKIPPKEEFLASCERFHVQMASESGVMTNCLTLAQVVAENENLTTALNAANKRVAVLEEQIATDEIQQALDLIPLQYVSNDLWVNGIKRMAEDNATLRADLEQLRAAALSAKEYLTYGEGLRSNIIKELTNALAQKSSQPDHWHCKNGCEKSVAVKVCVRCGGAWVPCTPEICDG